MELQINNQKLEFELNEISIQTMLNLYCPNKQKGIAVAVNSSVIPKSDWENYLLQETDEILIITATQGG